MLRVASPAGIRKRRDATRSGATQPSSAVDYEIGAVRGVTVVHPSLRSSLLAAIALFCVAVLVHVGLPIPLGSLARRRGRRSWTSSPWFVAVFGRGRRRW